MSVSKYTIYLSNEDEFSVKPAALKLAVRCALETAHATLPVALTVTLVSAEQIRALNKQYAGNDKATDVLSFPAEDEPYQVEPGEPPYLGDVIIAYPVAMQQAESAGIPLLTELQTLSVHGVLHLLGYDHDTPEEQAEMLALQTTAMDAIHAVS